MNFIFLVIGILIYLHLLLITLFTKSNIIQLAILPNKYININSEISMLILILYSIIATFLIFSYYISSLNSKLKKQLRSTEKASIKTQDSIDKVKTLEAKIETLETALKTALKK